MRHIYETNKTCMRTKRTTQVTTYIFSPTADHSLSLKLRRCARSHCRPTTHDQPPHDLTRLQIINGKQEARSAGGDEASQRPTGVLGNYSTIIKRDRRQQGTRNENKPQKESHEYRCKTIHITKCASQEDTTLGATWIGIPK